MQAIWIALHYVRMVMIVSLTFFFKDMNIIKYYLYYSLQTQWIITFGLYQRLYMPVSSLVRKYGATSSWKTETTLLIAHIYANIYT